MLDKNILINLKEYLKALSHSVTIVLQTGAHEKRDELKDMLAAVANLSEKLTFKEEDRSLRSPISFSFEVNNEPTGIIFSGIPGGHEFNSFILALLRVGGAEIKLDKNIRKIVENIQEDIHFEIFVSLSCHNCPEIVQLLNQFSLINPRLTSEMLDGGLFKEEISARNIQGVPAVYANGESFLNGKVGVSEIIEKLTTIRTVNNDAKEIYQELPLQDVTIIGGGPGGVAAAIYAARKGLNVTLIAERIGGQVKDTQGIENLISVPYTTGDRVTGNMSEHLGQYEITIKEHFKVENITRQDNRTKLLMSSNEEIETKTLIVATGAKWRELGVPGEKENIGNGVAYCPHCDGPFFKGKDVAVIGGGNSGIEAALDLAGIVNSVTVYEFLPELKADKVLVDSAMQKENIKIIKNAATKEIVAENGKVTGLRYQNRETDEEVMQSLSGVFIQIGLLPNSELLTDIVATNQFGEIIVNDRCETNVPGIFACGDVTTTPYKQIIISMGEGAKAALTAFDYLVRSGE